VSYYYTVAALPTLRLGEKVPISEEEFLQFAEDTLKEEDYQTLLKSRLDSFEPTGSVFADSILSWEKELRLELAKERLAKLDFEPPHGLPESDGRDVLTEQVRTALSIGQPLEAEIFLNKLRWDYLEEKKGSHFADLEALIVYYFKLQIALRQEKFQKEAGRQVFEKEYCAVKRAISNYGEGEIE
jgi:hypothetical protein